MTFTKRKAVYRTTLIVITIAFTLGLLQQNLIELSKDNIIFILLVYAQYPAIISIVILNAFYWFKNGKRTGNLIYTLAGVIILGSMVNGFLFFALDTLRFELSYETLEQVRFRALETECFEQHYVCNFSMVLTPDEQNVLFTQFAGVVQSRQGIRAVFVHSRNDTYFVYFINKIYYIHYLSINYGWFNCRYEIRPNWYICNIAF